MVTGSMALIRARLRTLSAVEFDVERPGKRFVAEAVFELLHVARKRDVVATLAHPTRDGPSEVDAGVGFEDPSVVGVFGLEAALTVASQLHLLPVADDVPGQQSGVFEPLEPPRGGLVRGVQPFGEIGTGHFRRLIERTVEGEQFQRRQLVPTDALSR